MLDEGGGGGGVTLQCTSIPCRGEGRSINTACFFEPCPILAMKSRVSTLHSPSTLLKGGDS